MAADTSFSDFVLFFDGKHGFGQDTAVVCESRSSRSSSAFEDDSLAALDTLHNDIENPGAFSDVSKVPENILSGWIFHLDPPS